MPFQLTLAERETHLNMTGDDHATWIAHSDDPWFWRRMEELGIEPVRTIGSETRVYHLSASNVSFRRKMQLSDEERARRASNMQNAKRSLRNPINLQSEEADQGS
ncbi:MAG: hypothetical protein U0X20_07905 [Caldilineaceae bacterium]